MSAGGSGGRSGPRYQSDERPPAALAIGLGLQIAVLTIAAIILVPMIAMRAAGASEAYLSWAVFATVAICGVTTILQSVRAGWVGTGHLVVMGASAAFISVCIGAASAGGPALLATLVVVSSFCSARAVRAAIAVPAGAHADRLGNGHHADSGHGDAGRVRSAGGRAGGKPGDGLFPPSTPQAMLAPARQIRLMRAVRRVPALLRSHQRIPCGQTASYVYGGRYKGYSLRA